MNKMLASETFQRFSKDVGMQILPEKHTDLVNKEEPDKLQQTVILPFPCHAIPFFLEKDKYNIMY